MQQFNKDWCSYPKPSFIHMWIFPSQINIGTPFQLIGEFMAISSHAFPFRFQNRLVIALVDWSAH